MKYFWSLWLFVVFGFNQGFAQENLSTYSSSSVLTLQWETDMPIAFERAKKEHKNVMIMVEEPSCKWCVKMKQGALSDSRVKKKLQRYILLKVKRSDTATVKQIEGFTSAIPSFHFVHANKESIETIIGYFEPDDFLNYLNDIEAEI